MVICASDTSRIESGMRVSTGIARPLVGPDRRLDPLATRLVRCGARLVLEDDACPELLILIEGWAVKYRSTADGHRSIVDFALPGDVLSGVTVDRASCAVDMLTDGVVAAMPRHRVDAVAQATPAFALSLCARLEAETRRAHERIVTGGYRSAHARVCRLLVELVERHRGPEASRGQVEIPLPLRQQHIADALGLRPETVCRALGSLRRNGIAMVRRGRLRVPDVVALAAAAESGDDGVTDVIRRVA